MSRNEARNRSVFRRWRRVDRDGAEITLSCSLLCFMETGIFPSVNIVIETAKSYYRLRRDTLHVFLDTGLLNYPPYCTRIRW